MLSINFKDPRPIYEQVRDSLRQMILRGAIAPGEKLPSVRELAASLAINPNTIQRSYRELESLGLIHTVPGKGAFAATDDAATRRRQEELLSLFRETAAECKLLGIGEETLNDVLHQVFGKEENA